MSKVAKCLKYSAQWCGPCKQLKPVFEKVAKMSEFKDIEFIQCDIESDDEEILDNVEKHQIRSVPTIVLTDENNNVLKKVSGSLPEASLVEFLKTELADA